MSRIFSPSPIALNSGLATVRILVGLLLIYHGVEIFSADIMNTYLGWEIFSSPVAVFMVYAGKFAELIAGIFLSLGLFTRLAAIIVIGTFLYITFFVGNGRFWYEDQHPFMFVLFGVLFLLTGPGTWSVDLLIFKNK